jgi:hypothetical protein
MFRFGRRQVSAVGRVSFVYSMKIRMRNYANSLTKSTVSIRSPRNNNTITIPYSIILRRPTTA